MTQTPDAEFFRYQRLFGVTEDGLQMKVTLITDDRGKIHSASIQMRAVEGHLPPTAHPSLWSTPFTLKPNIIGEDEFGGAA
jgi:hypothetical protein